MGLILTVVWLFAVYENFAPILWEELCIWQVAASVSTKDRYPAPKCHRITQPENKKKE